MAGIIDLTSDSDDEHPRRSVPDIGVEDEDDEDLKLAIAMSLQDQAISTPSASTLLEQAGLKPSTEVVTPASNGGLLGLDRKAMEADRLARLKRKRVSEDGSFNIPADPKITTSIVTPKPVSPPPIRRQRRASPADNIESSQSLSENPFSFAKPKVLLTSTPSRHSATALTAVSFRDLVAPPSPNLTLKSALLSSFIADFDWLLPHFDTRSTSFVFVLHAFSAQHRQELQADFAGVPNVRLIVPQCLGGGGNMHSKLILLFFKSTDSEKDWGAGRFMENVAYIVDLPESQRVLIKTEEQRQPEFASELKKQLRAMEVPDNVLQKLEHFDFAATKDMRFVASISESQALSATIKEMSQPGIVTDNSFDANRVKSGANAISAAQQSSLSTLDRSFDLARTGLLSLSDAISSLGLSISSTDPSYPPQLDFITSSLGNLSHPFVRQLYEAACGTLDVAKIAASRARTKTSTKALGTVNDNIGLDVTVRKNLRIYFPTDQTVQASAGGAASAGTICFQKKWWETNELIQECLHDCIGGRGDGILMHSKILYVRFAEPKLVKSEDGMEKTYIGWSYMGSANLSESAWGRITTETKSKQPKMTCRNWESGVIIPITLAESEAFGDATTNDPWALKDMKDRAAEATKLMQRQDKVKPATSTMLGSARRDTPTIARTAGKSRVNIAVAPNKPSLSEVFSRHVPVPIQYPAARHLDQQRHPWFFND
ncbi:hypothetical protein LTR05_005635 [Lithohypha guttulata]|uniref:Phospholipase D/nuclease n=1 Tax=Lithohypha guttulata TaxID=1690604 RepID=A0AAN7SY67_9EURO|nr:hypothetical protein LTR05_005635 [Lithohypha guttulata]